MGKKEMAGKYIPVVFYFFLGSNHCLNEDFEQN